MAGKGERGTRGGGGSGRVGFCVFVGGTYNVQEPAAGFGCTVFLISFPRNEDAFLESYLGSLVRLTFRSCDAFSPKV